LILIPTQSIIEISYRDLSHYNPDYTGLLFLAFLITAISTLIITSVFLRIRKIVFSYIVMVLPFGLSLIGGGMVRWVYYHYKYNNPHNYFDQLGFVLFYWFICFFFAAVAIGVSILIIPDNYISNNEPDILDQ